MDLTDAQWAVLEPLFRPRRRSDGRGREHSGRNVYTEYVDPKRNEWVTKIQPALKKPKFNVFVDMCKLQISRRELVDLKAGRRKPQLLSVVLKKLGLI